MEGIKQVSGPLDLRRLIEDLMGKSSSLVQQSRDDVEQVWNLRAAHHEEVWSRLVARFGARLDQLPPLTPSAASDLEEARITGLRQGAKVLPEHILRAVVRDSVPQGVDAFGARGPVGYAFFRQSVDQSVVDAWAKAVSDWAPFLHLARTASSESDEESDT